MVNENVRPNMLQEIAGVLFKLTEEAPGIYYFAGLIDTEIGRVEVFCEHPTTCPPAISIGKRTEDKAPARSMIVSVLFSLLSMIQRTNNSWNMVKCGLIEARKDFRKFAGKKEYLNLLLTCWSRYWIFDPEGRRRLCKNLR
jgi:hypothetical protein